MPAIASFYLGGGTLAFFTNIMGKVYVSLNIEPFKKVNYKKLSLQTNKPYFQKKINSLCIECATNIC